MIGLTALVILLPGLLYFIYCRQFQKSIGEPPLASGWIPFLGVAVAFGTDSGAFLEKMRVAYGEIFTLYIAGRRMHFIADPTVPPSIFKHKALSFAPIAHSVSQNAFGHGDLTVGKYDTEDISTYAELDKAERRLWPRLMAGSALEPRTQAFQQHLQRALRTSLGHSTRKTDFYEWVHEVIYNAGIETIFWPDFGHRDAFKTFDSAFALLAAGLPPWTQGSKVERSRRTLSEEYRRGRRANKESSELLRSRDEIFGGRLSEHDHERSQLAIIWASQANTIPACFWALAQLVAHEEAKEAVLEEVQKVQPENADGTFSRSQLHGMVRLESAVNEALRMCTASLVIRRVMQSTTIEVQGTQYSLREGDQDAAVYRYDRFLMSDGESRRTFEYNGRPLPHALMPFGGGISMCPGRHFAMDEIKAFVAAVLLQVDVAIEGDIGMLSFDQSRAGLGILPPSGDVKVELLLRSALTTAPGIQSE